MNKVELIGNLGADPELRYTASGQPVCNLRLATSDKPRGDEKYGKSHWHTVVVWGKKGEALAKEAKKGSRVHVTNGKIEYRQWEDKNGNKRFSTDIVAFGIEVVARRGDSEREFAKANDDTFSDEPGDPDDIPF